MAAGFKTATVRAADVPSTQTDFPSYVDLDRLGITTLAEAQSVRVYADSAKTTEWAREIVSVTEMHVKVPSLTSTVEIFVDWDGVRADYATTATYGRNAVWSDYVLVWHGNDITGTSVKDSAGNFNATTHNMDEVNANIGKGQEVTNDDSYMVSAASSTIDRKNREPLTMQTWVKLNNLDESSYFLGMVRGINSRTADKRLRFNEGSPPNQFQFQLFKSGSFRAYSSLTVVTGQWYKLTGTYDGTTQKLYVDGVEEDSISNTVGSYPGFGSDARIQSHRGGYDSRFVVSGGRYRKEALSANWETTERNNQNAESTFWGTWTDVSTATTVTNIISIGNIVELNNISSIIGT